MIGIVTTVINRDMYGATLLVVVIPPVEDFSQLLILLFSMT